MVYLGMGVGSGGIYCCVPHFDDADQTGVDSQEQLCRQHAAALGLTVSARAVFADTRRSVWKRDGDRAGWAALLTAVKAGEVAFVVLYRPGGLLRHRAWDGAQLIELCEERDVALHGVGDEWHLGDAAQRDLFLQQARRACQTAEALARASRSAHESAAALGRPHGGGRRAYGYEPGMTALVADEARIVQEIFARFLGGDSMRAIAWDLNARSVPTATGGTWTVSGVTRILDAPRYAGLRVFRGQIDVGDTADAPTDGSTDAPGDPGYRRGMWQPCISLEDWERAKAVRRGWAEANGRPASQLYLLTGLVHCGACGAQMVGTVVGTYRMYACGSVNKAVEGRCTRHVGAASLEDHVQGVAIEILESWDAARATDLPMVIRRQTVPSAEAPRPYAETHGAVSVRSIAALDGVRTGPGARYSWYESTPARRSEVLRFLFASVRIGLKTTSRSVFDTSRVTVVRNAL